MRITSFPDIKRHIWRPNASVGHWIIPLHLGNGNTRLLYFFLRIPCGRTHFNFLFPHCPNLIRNFGSNGRKSCNLAKYDNKLGQISVSLQNSATNRRNERQKLSIDSRYIARNWNVQKTLQFYRPTCRISVWCLCMYMMDIIILMIRGIYVNKYLTSATISESVALIFLTKWMTYSERCDIKLRQIVKNTQKFVTRWNSQVCVWLL